MAAKDGAHGEPKSLAGTKDSRRAVPKVLGNLRHGIFEPLSGV